MFVYIIGVRSAHTPTICRVDNFVGFRSHFFFLFTQISNRLNQGDSMMNNSDFCFYDLNVAYSLHFVVVHPTCRSDRMSSDCPLCTPDPENLLLQLIWSGSPYSSPEQLSDQDGSIAQLTLAIERIVYIFNNTCHLSIRTYNSISNCFSVNFSLHYKTITNIFKKL